MAAIASAPETKTPINTNSNHKSIQNNISYAVRQYESCQDWATCGKVEGDNGFDYIIVADSHGKRLGKKDWFIKKYMQRDWGSFLQNPEWRKILISESSDGWRSGQTIFTTILIGTTFTCIKIFKDRIETSWIGDSSAKIYKINETPYVVWSTKDHDYCNTDDIAAMEQYYIRDSKIRSEHKEFDRPYFRKQKAWDIKAIGPTTMTNVQSYYFTVSAKLNRNNVPNGITDKTNMTRCLGHSGKFSVLGFDTQTIPLEEGEKYKIVAGTDGFWGVMSDDDINIISNTDNDASTLCEIAFERWGQPWLHKPPAPYMEKNNVIIPEHNRDDIAVAIWSNM